MSERALWALIYLAVCGSVLGFTLFYYVLNHLSPSSVSLITLITPVLALFIGALVAKEQLTASLLVGTLLVIVALLVYLDLKRWLSLKLMLRWVRSRSEEHTSELQSRGQLVCRLRPGI